LCCKLHEAMRKWFLSWLAFRRVFGSLQGRPPTHLPVRRGVYSSSPSVGTQVSLSATSVDNVLSFGSFPPEAATVIAVCCASSEAPPSSTIMFRWTATVLWLAHSVLQSVIPQNDQNAPLPCAVKCLALISLEASAAALHCCPTRSRRLGDVAASILGQRFSTLQSQRGGRLWSAPQTAVALSKAALPNDNFRVSFQHFDVQTSNDRVLKLLASFQNTAALTHDTEPATEHEPPRHFGAAASTTLMPMLCCRVQLDNTALMFISSLLHVHLHTYSWRFSSGWLPAAVLALNIETCLSALFDKPEVASTATTHFAWRSLELFTARILDHIGDTIAEATTQRVISEHWWKRTSRDAVPPPLRESLISFLVYIWDPVVTCLGVTEAAGCNADSFGFALVETITCSAVAIFAGELVRLATEGVTEPRRVAVDRLAAVASVLNTLQRIIAEDARFPKLLRRAALETLALSR
jgi:hypothetical protein